MLKPSQGWASLLSKQSYREHICLLLNERPHRKRHQKPMLICIVCVKEMALLNIHAINHKHHSFVIRRRKKNELTYCVYSYGRRRSPLEYAYARVQAHGTNETHLFAFMHPGSAAMTAVAEAEFLLVCLVLPPSSSSLSCRPDTFSMLIPHKYFYIYLFVCGRWMQDKQKKKSEIN